MLASEKMAIRTELVQELRQVDTELRVGMAFGFDLNSDRTSRRSAAEARWLLETRRSICDDLRKVGFTPPELPYDLEEARAI